MANNIMCQFLIGTVLHEGDKVEVYGANDRCQFLIGTVLPDDIFIREDERYVVVSIPHRYGITDPPQQRGLVGNWCQFLIGTVLPQGGQYESKNHDSFVSIPHRYGIT